MTQTWRINVFGVRHLSPAGAWHLREYLEKIKPSIVLIEGLSDANDLIPQVTRKGSVPPIAILAYTDSLPVRTLLYPIAQYSPEYQAMAWATGNKVPAQFIDLPSDVFLALQDAQIERMEKQRAEALEKEKLTPAASRLPASTPGAPEQQPNLYERIALRAGENDYETYWERHFEHNFSDDAYRLAAYEFGQAIRDMEEDNPHWRAENLVREAFMRRKIQEAIADGHKPEKIVAVVGAYHAPVLTSDHPAMSDSELASLKRRASKFTLMPYSYFKLSSQSGYGAGNHAPAYFQLLWQALEDNSLSDLPSRYLTLVARRMRDTGTHRSTAEIIEGVRLANTLSALKDGMAATLADLRDSAVTLIGHGEAAAVKDAIAKVEIGDEIGRLPAGVSRTSIQADFDRQVARLKLDKYKTPAKQELSLDLRENRHAKTPEAAFLDLHRSSFFHRLRVLGISFVAQARVSQQSGTWAEAWTLQWSPESEIQLIEAVLLGETVELATAFKFKSILEACESIGQAAEVVRDACHTGMMASMEAARRRLQELSAVSSEMTAIAHAAHVLGQIVRYGDVRRFDPAPLLPLVDELFVQGAIALHPACVCDAEAAKNVLVAMNELNQVALEHADRVDEALWIDSLRKLSDADDRNPVLSGYACAILLERGLMPNEDLIREVSRRLSAGVPADLGAGWFEGLSKRNHYALLARQALWEQLADYIASLDEEHFRRSLVFLRRAFGGFGPREKRQIAENLAQHWGASGDSTADMLEKSLTEEEEKSLTDLNEFNFDSL
jgi:hypothetical protein